MPEDWKRGHLVKLPKKGGLSSCNNSRGIMLLSIPGKVLTRIIPERLTTALDKTHYEMNRRAFVKTDLAQTTSPQCEL